MGTESRNVLKVPVFSFAFSPLVFCLVVLKLKSKSLPRDLKFFEFSKGGRGEVCSLAHKRNSPDPYKPACILAR